MSRRAQWRQPSASPRRWYPAVCSACSVSSRAACGCRTFFTTTRGCSARRWRPRRRRVTEAMALDDLKASILGSWRTNSRVTAYLVEHIPDALWDAQIPGQPRRTVRMLAGHLHNARCMWLKTLGKEHRITVPASGDRRRAGRRDLLAALQRRGEGIEPLLALGITAGGHIPPSKAYVWRNLPLDVAHVLSYFVAHEGHHRGQIVMLARQLGLRLPAEAT